MMKNINVNIQHKLNLYINRDINRDIVTKKAKKNIFKEDGIIAISFDGWGVVQTFLK